MTEVDPAYAAMAARIVAAREVEEAARRVRRRKCFGYGLLVDELLVSSNPSHEIPELTKESARSIVSGVEVILRTRGQFAEAGRLGYRRPNGNVVPLSLWLIKFLASEYPTIANTLRAAEADLVD